MDINQYDDYECDDYECDACGGDGCPLCCENVFDPGSEECEFCIQFFAAVMA